MTMADPINQIHIKVGNTFLITARQPRRITETLFVSNVPGGDPSRPLNVLVTSVSDHFVASPIWTSSNAFGIAVNQVSPPANPLQSFDLFVLIQGILPSAESDVEVSQVQLTTTVVDTLKEFNAIAAQHGVHL
jgi:hypothetical protein